MDKKKKIFQLLEHGGNSSKLNIFSGLRNEEASVFQFLSSNYAGNTTAQLIEYLFSCLETLPEKCKEVINLYYFENQSIAEIKATIGMSESTVRNRLNYGLYLLKTQMAKKPKNPV